MNRDPSERRDKSIKLVVIGASQTSYRAIGDTLGPLYHVVFTPNYETALYIIEDSPVDAVFIGQDTNQENSVIMLQQFKATHPSVPAIVITESPNVDLVLEAFRAGARELLSEPIDRQELLTITRRVIELARTGRKQSNGEKLRTQRRFGLEAFLSQFRFGGRAAAEMNLSHLDEGHLPEEAVLEKEGTSRDITIAGLEVGEQALEADAINSAIIRQGLPDFCVLFFGRFRVVIKGQRLDNWPNKKGRSIFAYVACHRVKGASRDSLINVFWPKSSVESGRNSLNVAIHGLRRRLHDADPETEYILFKDERYIINPEIKIVTDVDEFRALWRKARSTEKTEGLEAAAPLYQKAAGLYQADFMADDHTEDWSTVERENLRELFLFALEKSSECFFSAGNYSDSIRICELILEKDSCREEIYRRLMNCYQKIGQRDKALKIFRKCSRVLRSELDVEPSETTRELFKNIRAGLS